MSALEEIQQHIDPSSGDAANLMHIVHMFAGYRELMQGNLDCPHSPGSAREYSWELGQALATIDNATTKSKS